MFRSSERVRVAVDRRVVEDVFEVRVTFCTSGFEVLSSTVRATADAMSEVLLTVNTGRKAIRLVGEFAPVGVAATAYRRHHANK